MRDYYNQTPREFVAHFYSDESGEYRTAMLNGIVQARAGKLPALVSVGRKSADDQTLIPRITRRA
jgi:hypothetical protein